MRRNILSLCVLAVCISGCTQNGFQIATDKELTPTTTTRSWQRSESGPLSGHETETVDAVVSVVSLDYNTRHMTVRNMHDIEETYVIAPEVTRLNEIKVGDKVALSHSRSMAFEVRPPTSAELANPMTAGMAVDRNTVDIPPGVAIGSLKHMIVTVQEINPKTKAVTVLTPDGKSITVYARDPNNLTRVKVGDTVAVTYSEALAVGVKPLT